jgi:hypothetical protein
VENALEQKTHCSSNSEINKEKREKHCVAKIVSCDGQL